MDPRNVPAAHSMDSAWFGVDQDGKLALFDTGEAGAFPNGASAAGEMAEDDPSFGKICSALGFSEDAAWEEGPKPVYQYQHDDDNWVAGRYRRGEAPAQCATIDRVPPDLRDRIAVLPLRFAETELVQPVEHLPCQAWGAVWLSADGTVARPFPGREREALKEWANTQTEGVRFEPGVIPPKPWWKIW